MLIRTFVGGVTFALVLGFQAVVAQTPFAYREYTLGTSVASVVRMSGVREAETRTLHERPATIQRLEWHVPYDTQPDGTRDPVRSVLFSFYNDRLYEIVVTYDRNRTEGLTDADVIEALSDTYGAPRTGLTTRPRSSRPVVIVVTTRLAEWEDATSRVTLMRDTYSPEFQLVLTEKVLNPLAIAAIDEATRLDAQEAPQRARDERAQAIEAARIEAAEARTANKGAFRP